MKKLFFLMISTILYAHPVPYTIDLTAIYDEAKKEASITCVSDNKNKCGLHNLYLLDKNGDKILTKKFPFLKEKITFKCDKKPNKLIFFLRKIPEHQYKVYFK